ncbi:hypothetical protein BH23CHL8_BH23CHL8_18990 [soil metagenome]
MGAAKSPAIRDPLVVDGVKYRIREVYEVGPGRVDIGARVHFGSGLPESLRSIVLPASDLSWDDRAGVWRLGASRA